MTRIKLYPPEVTPPTVTFRWHVEPATPFYRASSFTLRFPDTLDLSSVPSLAWWTIVLACLHPHWALLRPCRVELPVKLGPGGTEFWSRLLDAEIATLEARRGSARTERAIEIVEGSDAIEHPPRLPDTTRCATAFSGGKDSLLQTGLLSELTSRPVLVTTTAPMLSLRDHENTRRRQVLAEIATRRNVTLIEVTSDYRLTWDNAFSWQLGYRLHVNNITDNFLYFSALLAAGVAEGATHLFLASENEVQENALMNGRVVQIRDFNYSTVTQRALQAWLRPLSVRYGSLTSPLHSFQVQQLLSTRYADLRDLQFSCWQVNASEAACNHCSQCLRIAFNTMALGNDPSRIGFDLRTLLIAMRSWRPAVPDGGDLPPWTRVSARLDAQTVRHICNSSPRRVIDAVTLWRPARLLKPRTWAALIAYAQLRRRTSRCRVGPAPGYRPGYLRLLDPLLSGAVGAIFAAAFEPEAAAAYADVLARGDALTAWVVEPLGGE